MFNQREWEALREYHGEKRSGGEQGKPAPLARVGECLTDGCERLAHPEGNGLCPGCYRKARGR